FLPGKTGDGKKKVTVQIVYVSGDGKRHLTQALTHDIDFGRSIAARPAPGKTPEPKGTKDDYFGLAREVGKLVVQDLKIPAKDILPCMIFAPDGEHVFTLEKEGYLRRIAMKNFEGDLLLDVGRRCSWLALSKEGLIVTVPDAQEFLVVDPATFKIKRRVEAPTPSRVVASPATSVVISASGDRVGGRGTLSVFDLKNDTVNDIPSARFKGGIGTDMAALSADGKHFFTYGGIEQVFRFRVEGTELHLEQVSQRIGQNAQALIVSPDSKYVALPSGGGNYRGLPDHPMISTYTTYVYPIDNVRRPAFTLESGAYPRTVGFDPKADLAYAQNHGKQLIIFSMTGRKLQEHVLGRGDTRQFLVHPEGRRIMVLMQDTLAFVQIPEEK
ncbi:MAG: hypothetical protein U0793_33680, partial [Gemmataceae bacterium]